MNDDDLRMDADVADVAGNVAYFENYGFIYNDGEMEWDAEYVRININKKKIIPKSENV